MTEKGEIAVPAKTHWAGLDLIRLLPILVIVTYHYGVETATAGLYASGILTSPAYGDLVRLSVFLMILLSGAGLGAKYAARPCRPAEYIRSRAAAIYPVFWLCFFPLFLYSDVWHRNNAAVPLWKLVFSVVGLDGYLQPYTSTFYKVGEWYLGCQVLLYCLFPLTLWAARTSKRRMVLGTVAALLWAAGPWLCPAGVDWFHTVWGEWPVFVLGMLFGTLLGRRRAVIAAGVCLAGGVLCAAAGLPSYHSLSLLAGAAFWALFWLGQAAAPAVTKVVGTLAKECYGVFLIHHVFITLVLLRFVRALGGGFGVWLAFWLVCVAGSFVLAAIARRVASPLTKLLRPKPAPVQTQTPAPVA